MPRATGIAVLIVASGLAFAVPNVADAQGMAHSAQTDARWYPWLGCWEPDTLGSGEQGTSSSVTCIIPISGSTSAEQLTIARGKIVARDRLDAGGRPHAITGQGCEGLATVNWSTTGRRVFRRADYGCGPKIKGSSTAIFAISPTGDWLRAEEVRSGSGAIISVVRLRDIGLASVVPQDAARTIRELRLAIATTRASAAAPITTDEIIDAVNSLNAGVVRSWLMASDQRFDLDGRELAALARADVPLSVLQTILAYSPGYDGGPVFEPARTADVYMNSAVYVAPQTTQPDYGQSMYPCPPPACFTPTPYSAYNGFGSPFSPFPFIVSAPFATQRSGKTGPFRQSPRGRDGHDGHRPIGRGPGDGRDGHQPVVRAPGGRRP